MAGINYYIPYKLAFLNFYFIPILLGAFLCALIVFVYAYLFPESFRPAFTNLDLWMNIVTWASFLILTAAIVGQFTTKLKTEVE